MKNLKQVTEKKFQEEKATKIFSKLENIERFRKEEEEREPTEMEKKEYSDYLDAKYNSRF